MSWINTEFSCPRANNLWVVEFSQSQQAFSTRLLEEGTLTNLKIFFEARSCDHAVVAVARSHEEANRIVDVLDCREDRSAPYADHDVTRMLDRLSKLGVIALNIRQTHPV